MVASVKRYAGVNTKTRVLKSRLLKKADYLILLELDALEDQVKYLKQNTFYANVLKDDIKLNDVESIELALKRYLLIQYKKLSKYFSNEYAKLYRILLSRFEIEDLKQIFRAVAGGGKISKDNFYFKEEYLNIDYNKLTKSNNTDELINNLKGTLYYDALKDYVAEDKSKLTFYVEMTMDKLYFKILYNQCHDLSKEDKDILKDIIGAYIDLLNVEWIYRGFKFYDLMPEELFNYSLLNGNEFDLKEIKEMCYSTIEDLKAYILRTKYKFLFDEEKDMDLYMELNIEKYFYSLYKNAFKRGKFDILITISYLHLLEYEIKDIISIMESKRYGVSIEDTMNYLIMDIKGSEI
ncbi:hypothetical protein E9840_04200 [Tissierella creatinini]|nr:hypothetical protein E9840_04200 [Tissierella creatinini]TJX66348.1 hypothetical protein E8P77_08135 [Soehngenia saccharolytica]